MAVNPASSAKIVTASRIEASFLRVDIETCETTSVIAYAARGRIVVIPPTSPYALSSV